MTSRTVRTAEELRNAACPSCQEGAIRWSPDEAAEQLKVLPGWSLVRDGQRIARHWRAKNFLDALDFFRTVAEVAEQMQHHPDLHLENYRDVRIEIWTHSLGGLSDADFILAARVEALAAGRWQS